MNPTIHRVWPGQSSPLGANFDGSGVNFALFSEHATQVDLCLYDCPDAQVETYRIKLPEKTDQVWHGYLPDVRPGQVYGYRVHGPHDRKEAIALTLTNYCSILTQRPSRGIFTGTMRFRITLAIRRIARRWLESWALRFHGTMKNR